MTQIEMDVARSQIRANKAIASLADVNWEERRYEIAKTILPYCAKHTKDTLMSGYPLNDERFKGKTIHEIVSIQAVDYADALIKQLSRKD